MNVIVIGNGGHSKVIQEMLTILDYKIIAILDDKCNEQMIENGIVYAPISYLNRLQDDRTKVVIGIGDNNSRNQISKSINISIERYLSVIHPSAIVSPSANIGNGTVIMPKAVINANAKIGVHCIINTGAIIEHDNTINNYTHVSPNATLTGNVSLGEGVHVGASATIIPGIKVGHWSIIGAGSTVIDQIPPYKKAVGCPARILNK
ncbi:acetyltransferase [Bacillus sp. AFS055030]|uniref:acetyltransferase n=1 Tax=Bacillus sp. AFS055030 TaxID=2033507 RepID=UPI000BFD3874|nr:acetyltransferase [Bacillus sp. AFS055030]PGL70326.1 acetyltransferase [Bacillus sp. AFS055030]